MNPNTFTITKTVTLQGHSRPVKYTKFSTSGDLVFSASSDRNVVCWNTQTGEKLKTYAHSAAVNIIEITNDGAYMITGDNTGCVYVWESKGGILLKKMEQDPTLCVRSISLSSDNEYIMILYAGRMRGAKSFLNIYKLKDVLYVNGSNEDQTYEDNNKNNNIVNNSGLMFTNYSNKNIYKTLTINLMNDTNLIAVKTIYCKTSDTKYMQAKFAVSGKSILVSREDGWLELININNGKIITESKFHDDIILDFDYDSENNLILTASRDGFACVIDFFTFQVINKFHPLNPTRNLNSCKLLKLKNPETVTGDPVLSNINNIDLNNILSVIIHNDNYKKLIKNKKEVITAIVSGGQDSKLVTTTNQKEGGFEIIAYDALDGVELTNFQAHFGPVNTLAVCGNMVASGAEDATIRLHNLDNYVFQIDKNK